MDLAEWADVGSSAFTALAAGAAWAAVAQGRRERRASETPELYIEVIEMVPSGEVLIHIGNHGGPVKKVTFGVVEGGKAAIGHPQPTSFMRRGETRILRTQLVGGDPASPAIGVVSGIDMSNRRIHAASVGGKTKRWRMGWLSWTPRSDQEVFRRFYPDAPDPADLPLVTYELKERDF
jgi:hypothetical protein